MTRGWGVCAIGLLVLILCVLASGWEKAPGASPRPTAEYSGMYSFLREGEFVQVTVEDAGKVSGFVSRYGDLESDKGQFLNYFFESGRLDGNRITFATGVVHGISFGFQGTIGRGAGKTIEEEGYYVIEGTLTESSLNEQGKRTSRDRTVTLKSLPRKTQPSSLAPPPTK